MERNRVGEHGEGRGTAPAPGDHALITWNPRTWKGAGCREDLGTK